MNDYMSDVRERSNRGDSVEATRIQPGNLPVDPRLFSTTATRKLAKLHTRRARDPVSPFPAANGLLSTSPSSSYTTPMVNWLVPVGFGVSVRCSPVSLEERLRGTPRRPHVVHVSQNPPPARITCDFGSRGTSSRMFTMRKRSLCQGQGQSQSARSP